MPRGRKKQDLPSYDPQHYVQFYKGGRMRWHPDVVPALLVWLQMLQVEVREEIARLSGQTNKMPAAVKAGVLRQLEALDGAYTTLADLAPARWSRMAWLEIYAKVMPQIDVPGAEPEAEPTAEG